MNRILIAFLVLPLLLFGFAPADAASKIERDLSEMKRRLEAIEQTTLGGGSGQQERVEQLTRQLADQQAELDALRVEFQKLQGAFDDLQHTRQELHDLLNMMRSEMELKFSAVEERLGKLEQAPVSVKPTVKPEADPAAEYEAALKLIQKEGNYNKGRKALQAFIKNHPEHDLVVNASYWIGEAWYGEKKYENAILQFQDILQKYPKHGKAAAAQLKQALSFQALGDKETAVVLLKKVVNNYPNSPEANKAQQRLK